MLHHTALTTVMKPSASAPSAQQCTRWLPWCPGVVARVPLQYSWSHEDHGWCVVFCIAGIVKIFDVHRSCFLRCQLGLVLQARALLPGLRPVLLLITHCLQVVGDRPSVKEYLRLLSSALTLVDASEAAQLAKVKPFAVEVGQQLNAAKFKLIFLQLSCCSR